LKIHKIAILSKNNSKMGKMVAKTKKINYRSKKGAKNGFFEDIED
jgi:hypothetical protein